MTRDRESFLSRWSHRKTEARRGADPDEPMHGERDPAESPDPGQDAAVPASRTTAPDTAADLPEPGSATPTDLPDIEDLNAESDYSVFMNENVPDETRRQALRKLWSSDPVYAVRDGLNDWDEDYSSPSIVGAAVKTIYDAVKGYRFEEEEEEAPKDSEKSAESGDAETNTDNRETEISAMHHKESAVQNSDDDTVRRDRPNPPDSVG